MSPATSTGRLRSDRLLPIWVADRVARFGGSWTFIIIFIAAMIAWAVLNTLLLRYGMAFDVNFLAFS